MKPRMQSSFRALILVLTILLLLNLVFLGWNFRPLLEQRGIHLPFPKETAVQPPSLPTITPSPTQSPVPQDPTDTVVPVSLGNGGSPIENLRAQGVLFLSMRDGDHIHLFAYHPLYLPLARITNQAWDDITPAISPDGTHLAYSSRQNGYWDIYILDLVSGKQERITDSPEYEAYPTWSPDGQWIAYERYNGTNLDIYLQSLTEPSSAPIQLTNDPATDRSPAWSPNGREIAFVSSRTGNEEIWLARLDNIDDRFINISRSPQSRSRFPVWSADGQRLAWAAEKDGDHELIEQSMDPAHPQPAHLVGEGDRAAWSPDGSTLFSEVRDPQGSGLAAYSTRTGRLSLPLSPLPGSLYGMTWAKGPIVGWLAEKIEKPDTSTPAPFWQPVLTLTIYPVGRMGLVTLPDVAAPQPKLHDAVDEAFFALRMRIAVETGWDALSNLENAYLPLTTPPTPSIQDDWLYTGRAFAFNPLLMSAGWIVITKEDFAGQIYWHAYIKARYQDGSMGAPLDDMIWDINARYSGEPKAYENGGQLANAPAGYWVDLTEIAQRYGWERLPSLMNWRTFYQSIRYNEFVITGGLTWEQAMAQLYPPEALSTPTSVPSFTPTVNDTPSPTPRLVTITPSPTITLTPTRRPTWTPSVQQ
jgi:TolB protein